MLRALKDLPDAVAIAEPGRELTYREFDDRASRLAAALEDAGVRAGDTVACYLYNGAAYLETVYAAFKLGAVPANANYRYPGEELSELLTDADAAALVFGGALADRVTHAAGHVRTLKLLVRAGDPPADGPAGPDVPELEDLLAAHAPREPRPRPGSDRLFMYTGGTTGKPKGVMWQLGDLLHSIPVLRQAGVTELPKTLDDAASFAVAAHHEGRAPTTMPVVPLMHATGLFNTMGTLLVGGGWSRHGTAGGLDPVYVWQTLAEREVGTLFVAGNAVCRPLVDEHPAAFPIARQTSPSHLTSRGVQMASTTPQPSDGALLVISAHAGDFVWRAGGAIALAAERGQRAKVLCLSFGERGESARAWREGLRLDEIKELRRTEATNAAAALGAEIEFLDAGDYPLLETPELVDRIVRVYREVNPAVVLTHTLADPYNGDHPAAARMALQARVLAQAVGYDAPGEPLGAPPVFFFEPHQPEQCDFKPNVLLDITAVFERKRKAMECLPAQQHMWDYYTEHKQQLAVMQEDVDALEAQELMYATDPGGTAESSIRSDLAALRGRRALAKMLAREQRGNVPA